MFSVLLFDFDGTIADTFELAMAIGKKISPTFGMRELGIDDIVHFRNMPLREVVRSLKIPFWKIPSLLVRIRKEIEAKSDAILPFTGISEVLRDLRASCGQFGIVTSNSEETVTRFLKTHNLDFFDFGAYSSSLFGKAAKLHGLIHKRHLTKESILYIGDTVGDIESCHKAGIRIAAVSWGFNTHDALAAARPDFLIGRPGELAAIVAGNAPDTSGGK